MAAAGRKITYTAAEVAELIRPLGPAGEGLGETGCGAEPGHHGQLGDPVCPELAEAAVQAYEAAASGTIRDPRG